MAKVIRNFNIDLSDMAASGGSRSFSVEGDVGAIFSLEITNEDSPPAYYNFSTGLFSTTKSRLKQKAIGGNGRYTGSINFPSITDDDQYDIYLFAESHHDTVHADRKEVRFGDGSLDLNSSTGSNSNLLQKVIYQYTDVTITISPRSISANDYSTGNFVSATYGTDTITVGRGKNTGKINFSISVTTAATKALQIIKQPEINDIVAYTNIQLDTGVTIPGEDIWTAAARDTDTVNGAVEAGTTVTMDAAVSGKMKVGDRVTGTGISDVVTVASLSGTYTFVASEELTLSDGITLTFTAPHYYRWSLNSSHSIHKLLPGMQFINPVISTALSIIAPYEDTTTYTTEILGEDGSVSELSNTVTNFSVPALDPVGNKPVITNGLVTQQLGYITFADQISFDNLSDAILFYAYGVDAIKAIHNAEIKLTDLKVELTAPTTTTTEATSAHATIAVADREGVINNVSTVSGIGINASVANPTITSGGGADGAGDWVMGAVQTLENGITLTVGGTSRVATITGNIEVLNVQTSSFTLYFDIDNFLSAS